MKESFRIEQLSKAINIIDDQRVIDWFNSSYGTPEFWEDVYDNLVELRAEAREAASREANFWPKIW